jgi:hypothetical protein
MENHDLPPKRDQNESDLHDNTPRRVTTHHDAVIKTSMVKGFYMEPSHMVVCINWCRGRRYAPYFKKIDPSHGEGNHKGTPQRGLRHPQTFPHLRWSTEISCGKPF